MKELTRKDRDHYQSLVNKMGIDPRSNNYGRFVQMLLDMDHFKDYRGYNEWIVQQPKADLSNDSDTGKFVKGVKHMLSRDLIKMSARSCKFYVDTDEEKKRRLKFIQMIKDRTPRKDESAPRKDVQTPSNDASAPSNDVQTPKTPVEPKPKPADSKPKTPIEPEPKPRKDSIEPSKADFRQSREPVRQYTTEDYKNKLAELKSLSSNVFLTDHLRQDTFIRMFEDLGKDRGRVKRFQKVMVMLDKPLNRAAITAAADYLKKKALPFDLRLKVAERDCFAYKEHDLKNFKRGDKLPDDAAEAIDDILATFTTSELSKDTPEGRKVDRMLKSVFSNLGIRYYIRSRGGRGMFSYTEDDKEAELRRRGKEDQTIGNAETFFSYDIHDVFKIIEKSLHLKLSETDKTNIEAILEQETRDMRYKSSIKHGYNDINDTISKIERYINKRKRIDGHIFKFSEAGRYSLKQILKAAVAKNKSSHGMSSQELMLRLQNLII